MRSIEKNDTWFLTALPKGAKRIRVKWVFKTKLNELGQVENYKAHLVAKGYAQENIVGYGEVFAPINGYCSNDTCLCFIKRLDHLRTRCQITKDVFVEQPKGYKVKNEAKKVYKLIKAQYGLKQAPRAWFNRIESYFLKDVIVSKHSSSIPARKVKCLIISLYFDNLIYTRDDEVVISEFKCSMMKEFDMLDLGKMRYFLGIEVMQLNEGIFIS
ncbi:hypothetical protein CR513_30798, partial [Mucuna pruriens]